MNKQAFDPAETGYLSHGDSVCGPATERREDGAAREPRHLRLGERAHGQGSVLYRTGFTRRRLARLDLPKQQTNNSVKWKRM